LYPEHGIASLNFVEFPENVPVRFDITSDAPMNSFWIPQLSGQIYAMTGMVTKLHLLAERTGEYAGSSANLSGKGFSGMKFVARVVTEKEFTEWVAAMQNGSSILDTHTYNVLAKDSMNEPVSYFVLKESNLFDSVIARYMHPPNATHPTH
jgi:cytochrome o ubiquinol oxidase subunit 2